MENKVLGTVPIGNKRFKFHIAYFLAVKNYWKPLIFMLNNGVIPNTVPSTMLHKIFYCGKGEEHDFYARVLVHKDHPALEKFINLGYKKHQCCKFCLRIHKKIQTGKMDTAKYGLKLLSLVARDDEDLL